MLDDKKKAALKLLYQTVGIPFTIIRYDHGSVFSCPEGYEKFLDQNQSIKRSKKTLSNSEHPTGVTLIGVGEMVSFAVCKIDEEHYAFTCPISAAAAGTFDIIKFKGYLADGKLHDFMEMLKKLPIADRNQLAGYVSLIKFICTDEIYNDINFYNMISAEFGITADRTELEKDVLDYSRTENDFFNASSYRKLYELIKDGNIDTIEEEIRNYKFGYSGKLSENNLQNQKYMAITEVQTAVAAAMEGGVDSSYAAELLESWCQIIDKMKDVMAIDRFRRKCILELCRKVFELKPLHNYTLYTQKAVAYIKQHIHDTLTTTEIAEVLDVSRSVLSIHFTKDMGITIHQFIVLEKLKFAERLLKDERFTYSEISDMAGFCNQSHFIHLFKKTYGITPGEYRKNL